MKLGVEGLILLMVVGGLFLLGMGLHLLYEWIAKRTAHWHPAEPKLVNGVVYIRIKKYGCAPMELESIPLKDPNYDELMSQAESEALLKCISLNQTTKTLERKYG